MRFAEIQRYSVTSPYMQNGVEYGTYTYGRNPIPRMELASLQSYHTGMVRYLHRFTSLPDPSPYRTVCMLSILAICISVDPKLGFIKGFSEPLDLQD